MNKTKNTILEKYEIKAPDYDLIDRESPLEDKVMPSRRCTDCGDHWSTGDSSKGSARIMFTGDITCFEKQIYEAKTDTGYDFNFEFDCIKGIFAQSDLTVGNLETMLFPQAPYRTEKYVAEQNFHCNAPLEFLDAVRNAGFDVLTNANNHDMDTGAVGIGETLDYIRQFGFIQTGTFKDDCKRYQLIDVNGIRVGIVAFATEHNNKRCNLTADGVDTLLNDYSAAKAAAIAADARADGAEVLFCCIHWGQENKTTHNNAQERMATELANAGYDCIIGSHPHVLQDFGYVSANDKRVPVFYSLGNFVSHNCECLKGRSAIACVNIKRTDDGIKLSCSYVPIYTCRSYEGRSFVVMPIMKPYQFLSKAGRIGRVLRRILLHFNQYYQKNASRLRNIQAALGKKARVAGNITCPRYVEDKLPAEIFADDQPKMYLDDVTEFPVKYSNKKYSFSVYNDHAVVVGLADASTNSYTLPAKVLDLPVTSMADGAFANTPSIKKMNFKRSYSAVSRGAFRGCTGLEGFQLTDSITDICDDAFAGCTALTAAVIKSGVERIGSRAFAGCTDLRTVKFIPMHCDIAPDAFDDCPRVVFYCRAGSAAYKYAMEHGITAVDMVVE